MAQVVPVGERAAPVLGHDHRRFQRLGQRPQFLPGTGAQHPATGEDHRALGPAQDRRRPAEQVGIGLRAGRFLRRQELDLGARRQHVGRHLQRHRARPPGAQLPECLAHQPRHLRGRGRARRPLGHRFEHLQLLGDLVQLPAPALDQVRLDLPGQAEHRRRAGVGRREPGGRVQQAGAGHHQAGADLAGRPRVAIGHVRRRLLVPRVQDAQVGARLEQRVEERIELDTGQPEDRLDPFPPDRPHQGLSTRQLRHRSLSFPNPGIPAIPPYQSTSPGTPPRKGGCGHPKPRNPAAHPRGTRYTGAEGWSSRHCLAS